MRVSNELAALIHNHQTLHNCNTWDSIKRLLNSHFNKEINFDRVWKDTNSECYDWSESPQAFVNNFICRYAILETRFAREKLPNRDKLIKRKLWQGPPVVQRLAHSAHNREVPGSIPGWSGKIWAVFPIPSRPCSPSSE